MQETFENIIDGLDRRIEIQTELIQKTEDEMQKYGFQKALEAYQQTRLFIETIREDCNNGWIPVSERLPENRYLFRGKRIDNGEWVEGLPSYNKNGQIGEIEVFDDTDITFYIVDPSTICQCTGVKDKNGKMIWENDIVMGHDNKNELAKVVFGEFIVVDTETLEKIDKTIGWHYVVIPTDALSKCEPFCLSMPLTEDYVKTCEFEVVGNVFDNLELLEVQE